MFWKASHKNPLELYKFFKAVSPIINYFTINIENDGISILQMDSAHVSVLDLFIDKDDFSEYYYKNSGTIMVSADNLCKALSLSEKIDSITLSLKNNNSNKLLINFSNESRNSKMSINLLEPEDSEISVPSIDFNVEIDMSIGRFIKICKNLSQFGSKTIKFKSNSDKQEINIYGEGDLGGIEITLKETDKVVKRKINIKKKKEDSFELETKSVSGQKEITINNFVENITNTFSLDFVSKILSMSSLSSRVNIGLSNEMPMEIEMHFFKNSYLNYYIAPKIDDI